MAQPDVSRNPRSTGAVAVALVVAVPLVLLSIMVMVPPYTMAMFPVVVGATEFSPFLVILALAWCIPANRLLRGRRGLRWGTIGALVASALIAVRPLTQYTRVAASASAQLGTDDSPPRYSLLTALEGLPVSPDVVERSVPYAAVDGSSLTMKLYALAPAKVRPIVVVIYGGAWRGGDPTQCEDVSRALASRGFAVAAIDYRHAPKFNHPELLADVRRSISLLRDSAAAWGMDPKRIAVLGRSAGGHLAELAAYSPGDAPLQAVISIYAPYDLVEGYRDLPSPDPIDVRQVLRDFLAGTPDEQPARYHDASPSSHVRRGLPPTLLIWGGRDHIIKPSFNRRAASELRAVNVPVVAVEIPWAEHGFDMAPAGLGAQLAFNIIADFLARELEHRYSASP